MSTVTTNPVADLKANALAIAAKPLLDALASLQANPTSFNLAAQGVALQGALIGAAPALEALGIKDLAALLSEKVTSAVASASVTPTATSAA